MHARCLSLMLSFMLTIAGGAAALASPLDTGSWFQIARIADDGGGMFDGNGDLQPGYSYGAFTGSTQSTDFERSYSVYSGMQILFITGDSLYWGLTPYADLRTLIDAQAGDFGPNITFSASINGVEQTTTGDVLSREPFLEDPWISLQGSHFDGVANQLIIWGENNYAAGSLNNYTALKETHGGINVYVTTETSMATPLPPSVFLFTSGLGMMGVLGWRWKRKAAALTV